MIELIKALIFLAAMALSVWLIMRERKDTQLCEIELNIMRLDVRIRAIEYDLTFIKEKVFGND